MRGEAPEGKGNYRDHAVRLGDTSPAALLEKAQWVLGEMERRMSAFGGDWSQVPATQLYTIHNIYPFIESELGRRGIFGQGLTWYLNRPPVQDLEYEMDCRRVYFERVVPTSGSHMILRDTDTIVIKASQLVRCIRRALR